MFLKLSMISFVVAVSFQSVKAEGTQLNGLCSTKQVDLSDNMKTLKLTAEGIKYYNLKVQKKETVISSNASFSKTASRVMEGKFSEVYEAFNLPGYWYEKDEQSGRYEGIGRVTGEAPEAGYWEGDKHYFGRTAEGKCYISHVMETALDSDVSKTVDTEACYLIKKALDKKRNCSAEMDKKIEGYIKQFEVDTKKLPRNIEGTSRGAVLLANCKADDMVWRSLMDKDVAAYFDSQEASRNKGKASSTQ